MPPDSLPSKSTNVFPKAAGLLTGAIALLALVGWTFGIDALKRGSAAFVAMNPATAICFGFLGIAMVLLASGRQTPAKQNVGRVLAVLVLGVGAAKLTGYALGIPFRLDAMLFRMDLAEVSVKIPNQMAPNTAANLVLVALALIAPRWRPLGFSLSSALALLTAAGGLLAIVGYAYGVTQFTRVSAVFIPMALPTAICFLLLAGGVLCAQLDSPLRQVLSSRTSGRTIAIRLLPAATVFIIVLGWLRLYGERAGYFPGPIGTALFVVIIVLVLTALVWWTATTTAGLEQERNDTLAKLERSNAELAESHQNLQLIMNHASELICSLDRQSKFLTANEAATTVLGRAPSQLLNVALTELIHHEDRDRAAGSLQSACASGASTAATFRCQRGRQEYVEIAWSFQWASYHATLFAVGRATEDLRNARPWTEPGT